MEKGFLIAYDNAGKVYFLEGEAKGDVLPHSLPNQLKVVELPFGSLNGVLKFNYTDQNGLEILERLESVNQDDVNVELLRSEGVIE